MTLAPRTKPRGQGSLSYAPAAPSEVTALALEMGTPGESVHFSPPPAVFEHTFSECTGVIADQLLPMSVDLHPHPSSNQHDAHRFPLQQRTRGDEGAEN